MQDHRWLLDPIGKIGYFSEKNGLEGTVQDLQQVLEVFANEAQSSEDERADLLNDFLARVQNCTQL